MGWWPPDPLFIGDIDLGGEESGFEWLAVPIMVILGTAFLTIHQLANLFGAPSSDHEPSVNIDSICKTFERNCLDVNELKMNATAGACRASLNHLHFRSLSSHFHSISYPAG